MERLSATSQECATGRHYNIAKVSIFKEVKLHEHVSFTFHTTMLNALNHPNFVTVGPFLTDAGLTGAQQGFGRQERTNDTLPGRTWQGGSSSAGG